jgi:hypothetical protein
LLQRFLTALVGGLASTTLAEKAEFDSLVAQLLLGFEFNAIGRD